MLSQPPRAILCCGNISLDILVRPVEQFTWGTTTWVDSIDHALGGNGSNTAYTLGMLSVPVRLLGMVGPTAGLTTSLDTGWDARARWMEDIAGCLPYLDLLFMNQEEARILSGCADPEQAARRMQSLGAGDVVIKLGPEGCAVFDAAGAARFSGFKIDAVDTTGAGDCFVAGFLAALSEGAAYPEAARLANAVGAMSASRLGAVTGIRTREETEAWLRSAL